MSRRLDRTTPPPAAPLAYIPLPHVQQHTLSNGIPAYLVRYGTQEVVECQLAFPAGNCYETHVGLAAFTGKLLTEGTPSRTSLQLAQQLDDFGASISVDTGYELSTVTLSTLERHLPLTLNLLKDVVLNAHMPEEEFVTERERTRQRLRVEALKTPYQARILLGEKLFGAGHPYATHPKEADLDALSAELCRIYARTYFHPTRATLIVAGLFDVDDTLRLLESKLGSIAPPDAALVPMASRAVAVQPVAAAPGTYMHPMPGNVQSSVRVGLPGLPRRHESYHPMRLVNTLLGGFFGSRLMKNIREEKGYTYGIYSQWQCLQHAGSFSISADVGNEFVADTLVQIRLEMQRLREERVPDEELDVARNYLLGRIVSQQETPFQVADLLKMLLHYGLPTEELATGFARIQHIGPDEVQALAQQYLDPDALRVVVAGEPEGL